MCSAEVSATAQLPGCCASPPVWILCRGAVCSAPTGATLTADAKCLRIYNLKLKKGMIKSAAGFHIHAAKIHVQCANSKLKFGKSSRWRLRMEAGLKRLPSRLATGKRCAAERRTLKRSRSARAARKVPPQHRHPNGVGRFQDLIKAPGAGSASSAPGAGRWRAKL